MTETVLATVTVTETVTETSTGSRTLTQTQTSTATQTQTATGRTTTRTATAYNSPVSGTNIGTVTDRNDYVAAKTYVWTATLTRADTAGTTFTKTVTATGTYADGGVTYTGSGTATANLAFSGFATSTTTQTVAAYFSGQVSRTLPATGTGTGIGSFTWTYTKTATGQHTDTLTLTLTQTLTQTATATSTSTFTQTNTATNTVTHTGTATSTATSVTACLQGWSDTGCGEWCTRETQEDRMHCTDFLDCYFGNNTGPSINPDGTCGVNHFNYGIEPKIIADQVYQCLACPGTMPVTLCSGLPDGTPCTDREACTANDRCVGGGCVPGAPVTCTASDQCHLAGDCNVDTGVCSNPTAPDGTICQDGNGQTLDDTCSMGQCQGTQSCAEVAQVVAGGNHTCSLRSDHSLWCWGEGFLGQLGNGTFSQSAEPLRAGSSAWNWLAMTAGHQHTCGMRIDNTLWCWGANDFGQLGTGDSLSSAVPQQVPGQGWTGVQAGLAHTCGLQGDGSLWCWGQNTHGELGDGTQNSTSSPVQVGDANWVSVSPGAEHTCGLKGDHTVWCWGRNADGRLGNGSTQDTATPAPVPGVDWMGVSAGANHACGLKLDGTLWCWGANEAGQLGAGQPAGSNAPMLVGSSPWSTVSAGTSYTCGVQSGGTLWCWGSNSEGQLGDATTTNRAAPVRVLGQSWGTVSADRTHTCGRRQDGSLWCWGDNQRGQLGDGSQAPSLAPKQVAGQLCSQVPLCGDGTPDQGEECDDGNNAADDGCSPICLIEKCFGVVCDPSADVCQRNECDPATGQCVLRPQTGNDCDDGLRCTTNDRCNAGTCTGEQVACPAYECHHEGTCNEEDGACRNEPIDRVGCNVNLRMDGVVNVSGENWVALFGWNSTAATPFHPEAGNQVYINGALVGAPKPPAYLIPGVRPGGFLAPFRTGQTISWTVDTQSVSSEGAAQLQPEPLPTGGGQQVDLGNGTKVTVTPDMGAFAVPPEEPRVEEDEPVVGAAFNGSLTGSFSVAPSGAAIYTVPVAVPPGRNSMAPNLSLVYNSQASDTIAGPGWDLGGLSMIYRCPKTPSQDGYAMGVKMTGTYVGNSDGDGVCLDGKRLFPGPYEGSAMTFTSEYEDFSKVYLWPTDLHFTVVTKSGEIRTYGKSDQSRVDFPKENEAGPVSNGETVTAVWALERVQDVWGNYFDLHYNNDQRDFSDRGLIVTSIDYTGHVDAQDNKDADTFAQIAFEYQPRSDIRHPHIRFSSSRLPRNQLLKRIVTPSGTYTLKYNTTIYTGNVDQPNMLGDIEYCSRADSSRCLKPLHFEWSMGDVSWEEASEYALPATRSGPGTQLVDLDGDGLVDLVESRDGAPSRTYRNTGKGWLHVALWDLPAKLVREDGTPYSTMLMDVNRDGLPDLITGDSPGPSSYPAVWLNSTRLPGGGWTPQTDGSYSGQGLGSLQWGPLDLRPGQTQSSDINGDGRVEIVRVSELGNQGGGSGWYSVGVITNNGYGWARGNYGEIAVGPSDLTFSMRDVNRDGLPDLVANNGGFAALNLGLSGDGETLTWQRVASTNIDGKYIASVGDIDGDGMPDRLYVKTHTINGVEWLDEDNPASVWLFGGKGWTTAGGDGHQSALASFIFGGGYNPLRAGYDEGRFQIADVNSDGLMDIIFHHTWGGELLINTGATWKWIGKGAPLPRPGGTVPDNPPPANLIVPTALAPGNLSFFEDGQLARPLDVFVDINGDGSTDRVQMLKGCDRGANDNCTPVWTRKTYLNKHISPIITGFPTHKVHSTTVTKPGYTTVNYRVISSDAARADGVYVESAPSIDLVNGQTFSRMPIKVVAYAVADTGLGDGSTATTTYRYWDLRGNADGHGVQGFRQIAVTEAASGITTTTTYSQSYPYTGRPSRVIRERSGVVDGSPVKAKLGEVTTTYNEVGNGALKRRGIFIYPQVVTDTAHVNDTDGSILATVTTTVETTCDALGNPTLSVTTLEGSNGERFQTVVERRYGDDGSREQERGLVTWTKKTTRKLAPVGPAGEESSSHVNEYVYGYAPAYALTRARVEVGANAPVEAHTVHAYDRFGNATTTTVCGSDYGACVPGAQNSAPNDDGLHPAFRTTRVSYTPSEYAPSAGGRISTLDYQEGRFPVYTENAEGHREYTAFDGVSGLLLENTNANGIHTCFAYDALGSRREESARCGTSKENTTTFDRYLVANGENGAAKVVDVTRSPNGQVVFLYTDSLGRTVEQRSRSFDGRFARTATSYDALGRTVLTSKPYFAHESVHWTRTLYDWLGRTASIIQDLGRVGGGEGSSQSIVGFSYTGWSTTTSTSARGEPRYRTEDRNVLGKVVKVIDAMGSTLQYVHNLDALVTDTTDSRGNVVHADYDARGRRKRTVDPDMGEWLFDYDGFGDLIKQTDAKQKVTTMRYDRLGRLIRREDESGTSRWVFNSSPGGGMGKLAAEIGPIDSRFDSDCEIPRLSSGPERRSGKWYDYSDMGELVQASECIDGETFISYFEHDDLGRRTLVRYPEVRASRFQAEYHYTGLGYLHFVSDKDTGKVLWKAKAMNALGQVVDEQTGNGVETITDRARSTGWILGSATTSHAEGENLVQGFRFTFDEAGNLLTRRRFAPRDMADAAETFGYDTLDRLTSTDVQIAAEGYRTRETSAFDDLGNITEKNGKAYSYTGCAAGGGPHAVCTVGGGAPRSYDPNGNLTAGGGRSLTYSSSNKVLEIRQAGTVGTDGTDTLRLAYGSQGLRVVQSIGQIAVSDDQETFTEKERRLYVGMADTGKAIYERTRKGGSYEHVQFIYAGAAHGGNAFAMRVLVDNPEAGSVEQDGIKYAHFDHLGSTTSWTDESGKLAAASATGPLGAMLGYDAWGAQRLPDGKPADASALPLAPGRRQFTGQETIAGFGLVNMNGRVYDPALGRFLTADPLIQATGNLQSYNRYSYTINNPLRYVDPTGYVWYSDPGFYIKAAQGVALAAIGTAVCAASYGIGCVFIGAMALTFSTMNMLAANASWEQVLVVDLVGIAAGAAGGALGSAVGSSAAAGWGPVVGGAIGGAATAALTDVFMGRTPGWDVLIGASTGAIMGAIQGAVQGQRVLSQQGGEELSVELKAERRNGRGPLVCGRAGVRCSEEPLPDWIRYRAEASLRSRTTTVSVDAVEERVDFMTAARIQRSQVEYAVVTEMNASYDIQYSEGFSGTGVGDSVAPDIRADVAKGWTPLLGSHTHPNYFGHGYDYMSTADKSWATNWGVPVASWSANWNEFTVYVPDGKGIQTGICYGPACIGN